MRVVTDERLERIGPDRLIAALQGSLRAGETIRLISAAMLRGNFAPNGQYLIAVTTQRLMLVDRHNLRVVVALDGSKLLLGAAGDRAVNLSYSSERVKLQIDLGSKSGNGYLASALTHLVDSGGLIVDDVRSSIGRCTYLGGYGLPLIEGQGYHLGFAEKLLTIRAGGGLDVVKIPVSELTSLDFSGPGRYRTGGGIIGGGFGGEGMAEGMAIAAVLNSLTTRMQVETVIKLSTRGATGFWYHDVAPPERLRIDLAWLIDRITQTAVAYPGAATDSARDLAGQLERLHGLVERGILSDAEFRAAKAKLLET